jgi:ribonuclease P protein component
MSSIAGKITKFSKKEISYLFQHARRVFKNSAFIILLSPRQIDFGRLLIVASRKVGNAPERNKIRRRIKSLFYEEKFFDIPFDCVVIVYKKANQVSYDQLKKIFHLVYGKAIEEGEGSVSC